MSQLALDLSEDMEGLIYALRNPRDHKDLYNSQSHFLKRMIEWAYCEAPTNFDDSFVHSVYMQFHEKGRVSTPQVNALINIAIKFNVK